MKTLDDIITGVFQLFPTDEPYLTADFAREVATRAIAQERERWQWKPIDDAPRGVYVLAGNAQSGVPTIIMIKEWATKKQLDDYGITHWMALDFIPPISSAIRETEE